MQHNAAGITVNRPPGAGHHACDNTRGKPLTAWPPVFPRGLSARQVLGDIAAELAAIIGQRALAPGIQAAFGTVVEVMVRTAYNRQPDARDETRRSARQ